METVETKTLIVELDSTLQQIALKPVDVERFNKNLLGKDQVTVRDCVQGQVRHRNYLEYLSAAWGNHYGIVVSPDIFWHIALCEIANHIKKFPEDYRSLFTDAPEGKKEIVVLTNDPQLIDLRLIANELKRLVPTDIDLFLPEFTTSTEASSMAFKAAFAEAMTPYYNYSMLMCGIPKIQVLGVKGDWEKFQSSAQALRGLMDKHPKLTTYFERLENLSNNIISNLESTAVDFWKDIFRLERCGSGGQVEVAGWISDLFIEVPRVAYVENFPTCISRVPYTYLPTQQKYELCYGLFGSNVEDGYMIPEFSYLINEQK